MEGVVFQTFNLVHVRLQFKQKPDSAQISNFLIFTSQWLLIKEAAHLVIALKPCRMADERRNLQPFTACETLITYSKIFVSQTWNPFGCAEQSIQERFKFHLKYKRIVLDQYTTTRSSLWKIFYRSLCEQRRYALTIGIKIEQDMKASCTLRRSGQKKCSQSSGFHTLWHSKSTSEGAQRWNSLHR